MDATGLIASFATGIYTVTRRAAATYDSHGRAVAGSTSTLSVVASVQPATGRDLLRLPEGRRSNETRVVFTAIALLTGDQGGANEADLIAVDGKSWEVQHVESWQSSTSVDAYYRCIVQAAS